RLRDPVMIGLYSMLIHEGYTHAELHTIAPLFERWAANCFEMPKTEVRSRLAWISVHNGGTEKNHFAHSCAALEHYRRATNAPVDLEEATCPNSSPGGSYKDSSCPRFSP